MRPAASLPAPRTPEHELKFSLPQARARAVLRWLRGRCAPDPKHPDGLISSIYFDNRDLNLLRAKINSDFVKQKVRVRWYSDPESEDPENGPAFVELKQKVGARRFKTRLPTPMRAGEVASEDLRSPRLRAVPGLLREHGVWVPVDLMPFLQINFRRRRFVDPLSGARISIDSSIRATRANPAMLPAANPFALAHAVLEVKGPLRDMPAQLRALTEIGCRKESFSKYARCFLKITRRSSF